MTIQVNFIAKWRLKSNHNYVWTTCKRLVNLHSGKIVKKTTNGKGTKLGYFINRKFIKLDCLDVELIPNIKTPF